MKERFHPNNLVLNISIACDQACKRCFGHLDAWSKQKMDLAMAQAATSVFLRERNPHASEPFVMLFGGEPLLNWDLVTQYVQWWDEEPSMPEIERCIFTNALQLTRQRADFLLERGILLCISLDGDYQVHNVARPLERAAFDQIVDMIRYAAQKAPHLVAPHCVIQRDGLRDVDANLGFVASTGVRAITVSRDLLELWTEEDRVALHCALDRVHRNHGVSFRIDPEVTSDCLTCRPTCMMVYPDGQIYDMCYMLGTVTMRRGQTEHEDLEVMRVGHVESQEPLFIDVRAKRSLIERTINCVSVHPDYRRLSYLDP